MEAKEEVRDGYLRILEGRISKGRREEKGKGVGCMEGQLKDNGRQGEGGKEKEMDTGQMGGWGDSWRTLKGRGREGKEKGRGKNGWRQEWKYGVTTTGGFWKSGRRGEGRERVRGEGQKE